MARRKLPRNPPTAIESLPQELIRSIVLEVEAQSQRERQSMELLARVGEEMGFDIQDIIAQGPAAFFAMMGGAFHAAGAPPGPPGPAAPAAAAPQAPRPAPVPVPPPVVFGAPGGPLRPPAPAPAPAPPQGQPLFNFNSNAAPFVPNNPWPNPPPPAGEFDDMPPLEDVSDSETTTPAPAPVPAPAPTAAPPGEFDDMPPLEDASDHETTTSTVPVPAGEFDDMPPLDPADPEPTTPAPRTTVPVAPPAAVDSDSDDEMPPLEDVDEDEPTPVVSPVPTGVATDEESEWEDDEEYSDEDDSDEDNSYDDENEDSDDDCIFPDGLPEEPLLPIFFTSRPFLHAAREKLYRSIYLTSVWQASLLLRTLTAPSHAARNSQEIAEMGPDAPSNYLPFLVRNLTFNSIPDNALLDVSHSRGGASVMIDLIKTCPHLESLTLRPTFLKSSTKPFLAALQGCKRLQKLDFSGSSEPTKPFVVTTARIVSLLRNHLFMLEDLSIGLLRPADDGPPGEEDSMWEQEYSAAAEDVEADDPEEVEAGMLEAAVVEEAPKPKGLKVLKLLDPSVPHTELALILAHSRETLKTLTLSRPTPRLSRYGLASTFLTFFTNLTNLQLDAAPGWYPRPKPTTKVPFPSKPKTYEIGKPTDTLLVSISSYPYFLDAVLPFLPNLTELKFDGPLASTAAFSFMPVSLKILEWGHCTTIVPGPLARLLDKTVVRTKSVKNTDGSFSQRRIDTIVAKSLQCVTVRADDLAWKDSDVQALETATADRGICIHLSGGTAQYPTGIPLGDGAGIPIIPGVAVQFPFLVPGPVPGRR